MPDETDLIDPGPGLEDAPESKRTDVAAVEKAFSNEKDFRRWSHGESPNGSPDNDSPPPPWAAGRDYPYAPRRDPKAKIDEKPDFREFGGKQKAEEDPEATVKGKAGQRSSKAVQPDKGEPEEPDTKPRGKVKKSEAEQEEPAKGESDEFTQEDVDDELDRLKSPDGPAQKVQWDELKGKTKEWREQSRSLEAQLKAKDEELRLYKQSLDDDAPARLKEHNEALAKENETLRSRVQREDYTTSKTFQAVYQAPADQQLKSVLDNVFRKRSDGSEESRKQYQTWAEEYWNMEHNPDPAVQKMAPALWMENVVNKLGDNPALRDEVLSGLQEYYKLKEARNQAADDAVRDPTKAHLQYVKHRQDFWRRWEEGVQLGVTDLEKEWAAWPELKDKEAAESFKTAMYPLAETNLKGLINEGVDPVDLGRNQCRIAAKASVFEYKFKQTEKELAQVTLERDEAQKELRRISKVRSVPLQASGVGTRSRSRNEVDIFNDNPFKSGDAWKDSD
jgi:hypothetical protein